jgi:hypothetical protein
MDNDKFDTQCDDLDSCIDPSQAYDLYVLASDLREHTAALCQVWEWDLARVREYHDAVCTTLAQIRETMDYD